MTAKQQVTNLIAKLPDDCSIEEIIEMIEDQRAIEQGIADIENGEFYTHEEACAIMDQWLSE